jgi:RimJ/RimL family protein N-acetyltransferase
VDHAFAELGAERVVAETMAVNAGSRRVLEKCGLRHVETFHVEFDDPLPGTEHGEVRYEITRAEWLSSRVSKPCGTWVSGVGALPCVGARRPASGL